MQFLAATASWGLRTTRGQIARSRRASQGRRVKTLAAKTAVAGNAAEMGHHGVGQTSVLRGNDILSKTPRTAQLAGLRAEFWLDFQTVILSPRPDRRAYRRALCGARLLVVRPVFLLLSRLLWLRRWMETSAAARRLAARFVAGETLADALDCGRRLRAEGIALTLDRLGESVTSLEEAAAARDEYLRAIETMQEAGTEANVSLKLTQFGLGLSLEACRANVEQLVRRAAELGGFVRVDMESSEYVDRTLGLVTDLHARYPAVGTVIQAYLYRAQGDVEKLCRRGIRVRLCKGAYLEPAAVAFPQKAAVDRNYVTLMRILLERGNYPALATHDEKIIAEAKAFAAARKVPPENFEFQMLYGIRRDLQRRLVAEGYRLRLYVPFGKAWYPYYMRRLAERPANVMFILRNLLRR
jgi:proline dehydrogenase